MRRSAGRAGFTSRIAGFTLVEMLVAIALTGVVLTGLVSLVRGSLQFTSMTSAISTSVEDLSDAEGYLADTFSEAKMVLGNFELIDDSGADPRIVTCSVSLNHDCVGVLSPVVDKADPAQPIVNFDLSVFLVEPIGARFHGAGIRRGWRGADTLTLFEYRNEGVCAVECSSVTEVILTSDVRTVTQAPGYLLGDLSAEDGLGDPVAFFTVAENNTNFFLTFVVRANAGSNPFVVRETPVALQVAVRR